MKSELVKNGPDRCPHRSLLFSTGISRSAMERPLLE